MEPEKQRDGTVKTSPYLILASASPRRKHLLEQLRLPFRIVPSGIDERIPDGMPAHQAAIELALEKALEVCRRMGVGLVLGADTFIAIDGEILGKPADLEQARVMLEKLKGRTHSVITGLALMYCSDQAQATGLVETSVKMRSYSASEIDEYVRSGEPLDKAGAYAIQGLGSRLVKAIDGCYNNGVGLPLCRLSKLLLELAVPLPHGSPSCRLPCGLPCPETVDRTRLRRGRGSPPRNDVEL